MAGEFVEFFEELLFGSGAFIGLIIIIVLELGLVTIVKYATLVTVPISCLLIVFYLENIPVSSNFMWSTVIMFFAIVLMLYMEYKREG